MTAGETASEGVRPLPLEGRGAPPRKNGELVFDAPWQGRAFGIAVALRDQGRYEWDEFRERLIAEIAKWEGAHPDGAGWSYYARWLAALEGLLSDKGICPSSLLEVRAEELAARPAGHDHAH